MMTDATCREAPCWRRNAWRISSTLCLPLLKGPTKETVPQDFPVLIPETGEDPEFIVPLYYPGYCTCTLRNGVREVQCIASGEKAYQSCIVKGEEPWHGIYSTHVSWKPIPLGTGFTAICLPALSRNGKPGFRPQRFLQHRRTSSWRAPHAHSPPRAQSS